MMSWDWVTCSHNACSERVPSWEGVAEGNRCGGCRGVFCPHHFSVYDGLGICNSCAGDDDMQEFMKARQQ